MQRPVNRATSGIRNAAWRTARWGWAAIVAMALAGTARAEERKAAPDPSKPDTGAAARENAVRSIPFDALQPEARKRAEWILTNTSIFRRLPVRVVRCDADLYRFLIQNPDVVVNIWETLGISNLTMRRTGPDRFTVKDDSGTTGSLEYVYRSQDVNVAFVEGVYTGPIFGRQIHVRGIVVLKSGFFQEGDGGSYVVSRLDAFLNIEPGGVEFLSKTFQPAVGKVADNNFLQTVGFLGSLSRTAETNQRGVQRLAQKLNGVTPELRHEFAVVAERVSQRASQFEQTARTPGRPTASSNVPRTAEVITVGADERR